MSHEELSVRPITRAQHEAFLDGRALVSNLQRPEWAQVKPAWRAESLGWFSGSGDAEEMVGAAQVLHRVAPVVRKSLAYIPDGPIVDFERYTVRDVLAPLRAYLKKHGAFALRVGPYLTRRTWSAAMVRKAMSPGETRTVTDLEATSTNPVGISVAEQLADLGLRELPSGLDFVAGQPTYVARIPLVDADGKQYTDEQVLAHMSQTSRRDVRFGAKSGVEIEVGGLEDMPRFQALYEATADRQDFSGRPVSYFETLYRELNAAKPGSATLYFARYEGQDLATAIRVSSGATAFHAYGASSSEHRKLQAPKALQYRMIQDSIAEGCQFLDQGGVTTTLDRGVHHGGLTYFKTSISGDIVETLGEWELPLNPLLTWAFDKYMAWRER